jgi:hypothetical protein
VPPVVIKILAKIHISDAVFVTVSHIGWFFGFWIFTYSVACGIAATMRIFLLSKWFAALAAKDDSQKPPAP